LIELMVVVIIVGILATVSIPIYRANIRRACATEGAALLGSVLTAQKIYYAENNTYTNAPSDLTVDSTGNKWFTSYTFSGVSGTGWTATTNVAVNVPANNLSVSMTYTNAAGATLSYTGL